ncbi:MAG: NADPH-dependent F420 reductase [Candidatus Nanopelagicales bacterium]
MKIAVLGTGMVGRALAGGLAKGGHAVVLGTRDVATTLARPEGDEDALGTQSVTAYLEAHQGVRLADFRQAGAFGEVIVNATKGEHSLDALDAVGRENLAGKVLWDVCNLLDFSGGFPPRIGVADGDSMGERIQHAFPAARVVKALNTVNASLMVDPGALPEPTSVFLAGEDKQAKAVVAALLREFGWEDLIDLGGISAARGTETYVALWLRLMGALGGPQFNIKVVRASA